MGRVVAIRMIGRVYDHYGILDGEGNIIHVHKKKGIITCDPLDKVLSKSTKIIYMKDDFRTRANTLGRAKKWIGTRHKYDFLADNCESWVNMVRQGKSVSEQIDTAATSVAILSILLGSILT